MLTQSGPLRAVPAVFGLMLIGFGALIIWDPDILAYIIAGMFIFGGTSILLFALTARGMAAQQRAQAQVFYRRLDGEDG